MQLLTLVGALILERLLRNQSGWRNYRWLQPLLQRFQQLYSQILSFEALQIPLFIILFIVVLWSGYCLFASLLPSILMLPFNLLLLWFALGPSYLERDIDYMRAQRHDTAETAKRFQTMLGDDYNSKQNNNVMLNEFILWRAHENSFAVLFWFMCLGPLAALLYRVLSILSIGPHAVQNTTIIQLHALLAWLPARITGLLYAVCGDFVPAFQQWQQYWSSFDSKSTLTASGQAALHLDSPEKHTEQSAQNVLELTVRALFAFVFIVALFTLFDTVR